MKIDKKKVVLDLVLGRKTVVGTFEKVKIVLPDGDTRTVLAKIDTGAFSTSIDKGLAEKLGMYAEETIVGKKVIRNAMGRKERHAIKLIMFFCGKKITTTASVADRSKLTYKLIIGRNVLDNFVVVKNEPEGGDHG